MELLPRKLFPSIFLTASVLTSGAGAQGGQRGPGNSADGCGLVGQLATELGTCLGGHSSIRDPQNWKQVPGCEGTVTTVAIIWVVLSSV